MASRIFNKQAVLKPSAMATVADRRFDDARMLAASKDNARANGVAYFAGFVIEILLKAQLVRKHSATARRRPHEVATTKVTEAERKVWALIWRQHDLEQMLIELPQLESALVKRGQRDGKDYVADLKKICATWTIQARYSPHTMKMSEAKAILNRVKELKELIK